MKPNDTDDHLADNRSKVKRGNLLHHTTEVCLTDRIQNLNANDNTNSHDEQEYAFGIYQFRREEETSNIVV